MFYNVSYNYKLNDNLYSSLLDIYLFAGNLADVRVLKYPLSRFKVGFYSSLPPELKERLVRFWSRYGPILREYKEFEAVHKKVYEKKSLDLLKSYLNDVGFTLMNEPLETDYGTFLAPNIRLQQGSLFITLEESRLFGQILDNVYADHKFVYIEDLNVPPLYVKIPEGIYGSYDYNIGNGIHYRVTFSPSIGVSGVFENGTRLRNGFEYTVDELRNNTVEGIRCFKPERSDITVDFCKFNGTGCFIRILRKV